MLNLYKTVDPPAYFERHEYVAVEESQGPLSFVDLTDDEKKVSFLLFSGTLFYIETGVIFLYSYFVPLLFKPPFFFFNYEYTYLSTVPPLFILFYYSLFYKITNIFMICY